MKYIEIPPLENGAHEQMITEGTAFNVPDFETWAIIPDDVAIPDTYPFVDIITEKQIFKDGEKEAEVNVVISMTRREVPEMPKVERTPTTLEDILAMTVDQEYRLTIIEVGV